MHAFRILLTFTTFGFLGVTNAAETSLPWYVGASPAAREDAAIRAAIEDLQETGATLGEVILSGHVPEDAQQFILVGDAASNPAIAELAAAGMSANPPDDPQGFAIRTFHHNGKRSIVVTGGGIQGHVYGLYWLWDRMRVHWKLPDIETTRVPALKVRHLGGFTSGDIRQALRYTATWVSDYDVLNLVPWGVEPEDTDNTRNRAALQVLLDEAHAFHLKYLVYCDEFSYHPAWLAARGATLDLDDPKLWEALQAKYRALFEALPDLDGVRIRTGEHTRVGGNYRPLDMMHAPENEAWPLDRRYRTFVQKLHEVVVGEFDKIYFHRTWVANAQEQHSNAEQYTAIFTGEVPTEKLWLSPYMSLADRWYYQPYNPTFNLTPHKMVVLLSTLDYHAAGNEVFPSFPGQYHQGGMLEVLAAPNSNLDGVHFSVPAKEGWDTGSLTGYVAFRLAWEPWADLNAIARDFASIHLGPEAAPEMARALLLSHEAYKDGIYIKPVAEGIVGNTLPHLRLTTFPLQGIPQLDHGRAHIEWLRDTMMGPCRGREDETLAYLDLGLAAARVIEEASLRAKLLVRTPALAESLVRGAAQTRWLVETNMAYVVLCLSYFAYDESPTPENHAVLVTAIDAMRDSRTRFTELEGFSYKLYGIDQLMENAQAALDDLPTAKQTLANAPTTEGAYVEIARRQSADQKKLAQPDHGYTKALRWRGQVDGKDLLCIQGDRVWIEHLAYDDIQSVTQDLVTPLPAKPVDVVVRDIESQEPHPFVLTQPTAENDYTATLYLYNRPPGYNWWEFEVYFKN